MVFGERVRLMRMVLVVAAMEAELKPLRDLQQVDSDRLIFAAKGPGFKLARKAIESVSERPDVLVSVGICGALDETLAIGDIFVATRVNRIECALPRTQRKFAQGALVSQDRVAASVDEKRRLREAGASAVDMEARVVAERGRELGVPFYCIRAVSDTASEGFILDLNAARDRDGRFSVMRILGQAVRRPQQVVPELFRLKRNSELAVRRLGEFFADCRF